MHFTIYLVPVCQWHRMSRSAQVLSLQASAHAVAYNASPTVVCPYQSHSNSLALSDCAVTGAAVLLQFYILRKLIEHELGEQQVGEDDCYICSLSSRILVYKGQLTPGQVDGSFSPAPCTKNYQAGCAQQSLCIRPCCMYVFFCMSSQSQHILLGSKCV